MGRIETSQRSPIREKIHSKFRAIAETSVAAIADMKVRIDPENRLTEEWVKEFVVS
ncbi:hypothetical protein [[Phormidium] sp. ETS-05]|uniref:hypothetical protein n=1 Tax=[Phormidium] sp. ETS-05 TaxID=222819 RepID=UPI0018EF08EC|nr:hypothetical protein [[Phormidium] sp. ETS-05]